jgi:hypothetical protein
MHWVLWLAAFFIVNIPILTLLADRIFAVPSPRVIKYVWIPAGIALVAVLALARAADPPLLELLTWGLIGGVVATIVLDLVRLFGHHVLKAFPVDMPQVFGMLALGLGPQLQEHMIARLVGRMADVPSEVQRKMLGERLVAMVRLPEPVRVSVVRAMRKGLSVLPEEKRVGLMQTQMALLAELPGEIRRPVMRAMDLAMADGAAPVYAQPRGMPRIPMHVARELLDAALPMAAAEAGVSQAAVLLAGYSWHVLNGLGFGLAYTLLFGAGTWALALAWGVFIWAGMMGAMPVMMPLIRFPMPGFLAVPFIAHLVMAVPIGYYALRTSAAASAFSLLAAVLR